MTINVAGSASRIKPKESALHINFICLQNHPVSDIFFLMAEPATQRGMLSFQSVTGLRMVKMLLSVSPINQIVRTTLMFHMA